MAGQYQSQPEDMAAIADRIRKLEARLDSQNAALAGIGIHINGATGDLIIDANAAMSANFDGVLSPPAAGTMGWAGTGAAFIVNTLVAKNAIIDDDALNTPVTFGTANGYANNFSVPTSYGARATATMTVPAGFTKAGVVGAVICSARNTTAGLSALTVSTEIDGVTGTGQGNVNDAAAGTTVTTTHLFMDTATGLSGSFAIRGLILAGAAWSADAINSIAVHALAVFSR